MLTSMHWILLLSAEPFSPSACAAHLRPAYGRADFYKRIVAMLAALAVDTAPYCERGRARDL